MCVTEDHLPIRWDCGTRLARDSQQRAIRRRVTLPFSSDYLTYHVSLLYCTSRDHHGLEPLA
jgi:hypothetical protein